MLKTENCNIDDLNINNEGEKKTQKKYLGC